MMIPLQQTLHAFAHYLRDPAHTRRPPGLPARPLALYGELLFNNLVEFLDTCFPVCRDLLGEARWRRLERRFFRDWPSQTPWFREIPGEFLAFLTQHGAACRLPAWFTELAHYEWAELAVDVMDCPAPAYRVDGDVMRNPVVANPALMNLTYRWPVHRIGRDYRPRRTQPTHLVLYRDRAEVVRFALLTPASARLLALLCEGGLSGEAAILRLADALGESEPSRLLVFGRAAIDHFQHLGLVLGVEP
jgi:hypothetical protein